MGDGRPQNTKKNLGYSQQTGPHWPSPGKHRRSLRCWSTSWIRWWCNNLYVSPHVSLEKRHRSPTLLQRGRNFPPVSHDKQGSAGKLHQQECGDPLLVFDGVCGSFNLTYFNRGAIVREWQSVHSCNSSFISVKLTVSVHSRLRYCSFWAGVPRLVNSVLISVFWMSQSTATDGSTFASSSMTRMEEKNVEPVPPYCGSISMPMSYKKYKIRVNRCKRLKKYNIKISNNH